MKTIIAPTDFSSVSLNAVNYAAEMAVALNAELLLINVVQIPVTVSEGSLTEYEFSEMTEDAEQKLVHLSNQLSLLTRDKINIHTKIMIGGVAQKLKEICKHREPIAVVMGTKGTGAAEHFFAGSNTLYAVANLESMVLVVPQNVSFKGIKKIALASDLKEVPEDESLKLLKEWLLNFNATIDIINVCEQNNIKTDTVSGSISLLNYLSEFHPQFHFIDRENVEEGVYEFVEENKPDLLIIMPKRRGFFEALFHKSQSKQFILHPRIPILAISE